MSLNNSTVQILNVIYSMGLRLIRVMILTMVLMGFSLATNLMAETLSYNCMINSNGTTPRIPYTTVAGSLELERCGDSVGNVDVFLPLGACNPSDPLGPYAPIELWDDVDHFSRSYVNYGRLVGGFWIGRSEDDDKNYYRLCSSFISLQATSQALTLVNATVGRLHPIERCDSGYVSLRVDDPVHIIGFGGQGITGAGLYSRGADQIDCAFTVSK